MPQLFDSREVATALSVTQATYLGTGTYGETYRISRGGQERAIKIIHQTGHDAKRLEREIAAYGRVTQVNVVRLFDVHSISLRGAELAALEFEFINGGDLRESISRGTPTAAEVRGLAMGLLAGVAALHAGALLHRDLKPANVALRDGRLESPVILDLGLTKLLDVESITRYPARIGSVMYMAPEQLCSERALRASDLWAVGVIVFEVATGVHPFFREGEALTLDEALARLAKEPPLDPLPPEIADLVGRALADPPYLRGTVAKALERLARGD